MSTEAETFECLGCEGRGEVYAGYRDPETNAPVGRRCPDCNGVGSVPLKQVTCDMCEQVTPEDAICAHRSSNLCPSCSLDVCSECRGLAIYYGDEEPVLLDVDRFWLDAS